MPKGLILFRLNILYGLCGKKFILTKAPNLNKPPAEGNLANQALEHYFQIQPKILILNVI